MRRDQHAAEMSSSVADLVAAAGDDDFAAAADWVAEFGLPDPATDEELLQAAAWVEEHGWPDEPTRWVRSPRSDSPRPSLSRVLPRRRVAARPRERGHGRRRAARSSSSSGDSGDLSDSDGEGPHVAAVCRRGARA